MRARLLGDGKSGLGGLYQILARASATEGLPERVAALVRKKDRESEKLLCFVQLSLAGTLGILYALAPRPIDAGMAQIAPVPTALLGYTCLIVARMALVRRGPLSGLAVVLSIFADMGLLLGLIWSFHIFYGQPPAFSLKAPTFVYVFVFIAIRALRFDFRYVLAAGLAAGSGWLIVTSGAISSSPAGSVTRSFSDYILTNGILIGAEFDKIFAILVVTGVLGLSTYRAERTLVSAVKEEAANREIGRFLSKGVADQIARAQVEVRAGDAMERDAAILFLDIRGFTRFSTTTSPSAVVAVLTSFHMRIVPIVRAHHGVIDKFLGDGVMVTFGAVQSSATAAADALGALEELLVESKAWTNEQLQSGLSTPLVVNASVAAGPVVFAAVGNENRLEYTVIGAAVNLAAKLEKQNKIEGSRALLPLRVLQRAREQGHVPSIDYRIVRDAAILGVDHRLELAAL